MRKQNCNWTDLEQTSGGPYWQIHQTTSGYEIKKDNKKYADTIHGKAFSVILPLIDKTYVNPCKYLATHKAWEDSKSELKIRTETWDLFS
jgi:hypothetical protein